MSGENLDRWDELSDEELSLVRSDPETAEKLAHLESAERWLDAVVRAGSSCPPPEELLDLAHGPGARALTMERREQLATHVADCEDCRRHVESLDAAPTLLLEDPLGAPPLGGAGPFAAQGTPDRQVAPRRVFGGRWVAAAAAVLFSWGVWQSLPPSPESPGRTPSTLMRGERAPELVSPRGRALAAADGAAHTFEIPLWSVNPVFEARPLDGAESYRVRVWRTAGGALDVEGELALTLDGPLPTLTFGGTLAPGTYTWEAWARKDGLEVHRGSLDFEIVESVDIGASLAEASGMDAVELLDAEGFFADARRLARELGTDASRAYLERR